MRILQYFFCIFLGSSNARLLGLLKVRKSYFIRGWPFLRDNRDISDLRWHSSDLRYNSPGAMGRFQFGPPLTTTQGQKIKQTKNWVSDTKPDYYIYFSRSNKSRFWFRKFKSFFFPFFNINQKVLTFSVSKNEFSIKVKSHLSMISAATSAFIDVYDLIDII